MNDLPHDNGKAALPIPTTTAPPAIREDTARDLAINSVSGNTKRAYGQTLERFDDWCTAWQCEADDAGIAAYLAELFEAGKSPAVAGQVVAALRFRAKRLGVESPIGPKTSAVLAGFRRKARDRGQGQVAGVNWSDADAVVAILAKTAKDANHRKEVHKELRDAALIAVMSDAMLRVSEAEALDYDDLRHAEDGTARLTIRHSKTDQEGDGAVMFLGKQAAKHLVYWTDAAGISEGPLFQRLDRAGNPRGRLSSRSIRAFITKRAGEAGLEGRVSGHSLRVGAAQSLASAGASLVEMQQAGRWESPTMPGRYAKAQLAARGAVARLRYGGEAEG